MRRALVALAIVGAVGCSSESTTGWLAGRAARKAVTLSPSDPTALEDFPAAIVTTVDDDLHNGARADGADFVVTDADGTILPIELESFEPDSGRLALWVRLAKLDGPTTVYLYYGGEPLAADPRLVWSARFIAVWHFADLGLDVAHDSGATGFLLDQPTPTLQPVAADGIAGGARQFDGVDDELGFDDPGGTPLDPGTASFSVCLWVLPELNLTSTDTALYKGGSNATDSGYDFELGQNGWSTETSDGGGSNVVHASLSGNSDGMLGRWSQLCAVIDRDARTYTAYTNGAPRSVEDLTNFGSIGRPQRLQLGRMGAGFALDGTIDELHIYRDALPPAWVTAEYENLIESDRFVQFAPEERAP